MLIRRQVVRILSTENIDACGIYLKVTSMLNFGFIQILKNPAFAPKGDLYLWLGMVGKLKVHQVLRARRYSSWCHA